MDSIIDILLFLERMSTIAKPHQARLLEEIIGLLIDDFPVLPKGMTWNIYTPEYSNTETLRNGVLAVLTEVDKQWVPHLSVNKKWDGLMGYLNRVFSDGLIAIIKEDQVIGFVAYRQFYKDEEYEGPYLSTVAVLPKFQGTGLGKKLIKACLAHYKRNDIRSVVLTTWSTNPACILYEQLGFREIKRIENARGPGIDTIYYQNKFIEPSVHSAASAFSHQQDSYN